MLSELSDPHQQPKGYVAQPECAEPVDLKHLRRFTMGDQSLEREVLQLFLMQLPITIKALQDAATDREWLIAAHTLKGSGRAVGAWHIAKLAENAERQPAVHQLESKDEAVTRFLDAMEAARAFIQATYANAS